MTKEEAIKKYNSKWWKNCSDYEIVKFQLFERRTCMPFARFREACDNIFHDKMTDIAYTMVDRLQKRFNELYHTNYAWND